VPAQEDLVARIRQIKGLASCTTPQTVQKNLPSACAAA